MTMLILRSALLCFSITSGVALAYESDAPLALRREALTTGQATAQIGGQHSIKLVATRVAMIEGTVCGWIRQASGLDSRLYLTCPAGSKADGINK